MDDVIGHITLSQPKASSYTFWHNLNWSSNVALNQGDKLAMWVSYQGWDMTNKDMTSNQTINAYSTLHMGTIITF